MKEKIKKRLSGAVPGLLILALFAFLGFAVGYFAADASEESGMSPVVATCICIVALVVSMYLHIVLHEGGHLIMGLASGYRFVSFRIGSFIWLRQGETIVRKKFSIPGTAGQCLLDPPDLDEKGEMPCLLYNLGGGLSNLFFAGLAVLAAGTLENSILKMALIPFAAVGIYLAVMNLLPLKIGGIANDGYNIRSFRKNKTGVKALFLQLRINRLQQTDGLRLSEIPDFLFDIPGGESVESSNGDPLTDALLVFRFQRLIDQKRFDEAADLGRKLEALEKILPLYQNAIRVELLYLELIGSCRQEEVERLYDKALKKYLKGIRSYPSAHRVLYAYALRYQKDEKTAAAELAAFENAMNTYPVPGDIRAERELMKEITEVK